MNRLDRETVKAICDGGDIIAQREAEEIINATWLPATAGPVCAYWSVEDTVICGHASCYTITEENGDPGYDQ